MTIKRINEFPEGSGSLTTDDIFLFMDDPAGSGVTKKISLSQIGAAIGGISITNSGDNRLLTSTGSTVGVNAESNLTFDGSLLSVSGNLVANSGSLNRLIFNTTLGDPDLDTAQLAWNPSEGTVDLGVSDSYAMHLGEELHYRVRNNTGSILVKGTPVYASGITAGGNPRIEVAPFTADGLTREVRFMGLVTENINTGVNGYTTHFGYIRGIDTRGDYATNGDSGKLWTSGEPSWSEGDILYPHPTAAGKLTKVEPKHSISVAIVLNRHQNVGKIFVRPTSYGHLDDNHDVNISGVTDGQFLQYNSSTDYWVPSSSGNFSTLQVNGTGVSLSGHTHTASEITDFNSSVSGLLTQITTIGPSASDILSLSSGVLGGVDGNTIDNSDPFIKWDDTAGKLVYANPLSRPSGAMYVGLAPSTTALGSNAINVQATRLNAADVASGSASICIGTGSIRASGNESIAMGVGSFVNASRAVGIGYGPSATGASSVCITGLLDVANGVNSAGINGSANLRAQFATRPFSAIYWGGQTTNDTPLILNLDSTATNRFTIAANTALIADIFIIARSSDNTKFLSARRSVAIYRDNANNTALIGSVQTLGNDQSVGSPSWSISIIADDVNDALQLQVTGATGETVNWRATAFYRVV